MKLILDKVEKVTMAILAVLYVVMVISLFNQIVLRFIFKSPNVWGEELTRYSFIWLSILGASIAVRRSRNMTVDYFVNLMPKTLQRINLVGTGILIIVFTLVLIVYGIYLTGITYKQSSAAMRVPMSYVYAAVPVGGILMLIFTIEIIINQFKDNKVKES